MGSAQGVQKYTILYPWIRHHCDPPQACIRLRQFFDLLSCCSFRLEQRRAVFHAFVRPVCGILIRKDPFHAGPCCCFDKFGLIVRSFEAKCEERNVLVIEGGLQKRCVII